MPVYEKSFTVTASPEVAFDYLADRSKEVEWNPGCTFVEPLTTAPIGVGSRWRAQWKGGPVVEGEVLEYDRPHRVASGNQGALEVRSTWTFTKAENGTRIGNQFDVTPHGFMKLLFPIFARRFRKESATNFERIAAVLDGRSTANAGIEVAQS